MKMMILPADILSLFSSEDFEFLPKVLKRRRISVGLMQDSESRIIYYSLIFNLLQIGE